MVKIGILGASGFIGNRAVEMLHEQHQVYPIVRTAASKKRLTQQNLDCRIANALDESALQTAFADCEIVIHSILGSPGLIRGTIVPTYRAAQKAGVRRLIYLSTMCVHSQAPAPGTTEETPLSDRQLFPYNRAKIYAERKLLQLRAKGSVEVVIFRPGIVFGPQSRWIVRLADELRKGTAYLINEGKGICNTVYVDNLIHAMLLAMTNTEADGEAFFVGEQELVSWADFYHPFALAFGISLTQIHHVNPSTFTTSWKKQLSSTIRDSVMMQRFLASIPNNLKQTLKSQFSKPSPSNPPTASPPQFKITPEMVALQACQYKLPLDKAQQILSYKASTSFANACKHCLSWLAAEGYPINHSRSNVIYDGSTIGINNSSC